MFQKVDNLNKIVYAKFKKKTIVEILSCNKFIYNLYGFKTETF